MFSGQQNLAITGEGWPANGPAQYLRRTDNDLDFDAKDHHDQQQEEQIADHVCTSSEEPAGPFPAGFWIFTDNHEEWVEAGGFREPATPR